MSILFKKGGKSGIYTKPENRGKFTATKKKTGKTTEELTHSKNPITRKRAVFAQNAKRWSKKDCGGIMFAEGGKAPTDETPIDPTLSPYIYDPATLEKDARVCSIQTRTGSGVTRCTGSALDAAGALGFNYRDLIERTRKNTTFTTGNADGVVDAWDIYDVFKNSDEIDILYDRERDGELTEEMLSNLPAYSWIGTGDARGVYVDKALKNRVSRHGIVTVGFTKDGKPIVYDLGKLSEGIPDKYRRPGEINFIAAPKDAKYFKQPVREATAPADAPILPVPTSVATTETDTNDIEPVPLLSDAKKYIAYLRSIHSKKQNKLYT